MKTPLLRTRLARQQGTVLSHVLCTLGGVFVGFVIAAVGGGILAAFALPSISSAHEKAMVATASRSADQAPADSSAKSALWRAEQDSTTRETSSPSASLGAAREATARRNAQALASAFAAGEAAGVEWAAHDVDSAVSRLLEGVAPKSGPFAGRVFCVPSRTINDMDQAKNYLQWDSAESALKYIPADGDRPYY